MHCTRYSSGCSLIQGIYARLTWGVHLPSIYMHCTRYSSWCSLIQGIHAWLNRGVHLPSIYMHSTRYSSWCSLIQGIHARLTGGVHLPSIYMHCTRYSSGCSLKQGIYARLTGNVHLPSIYMHCTRCSSGCSGMQGICGQMTVGSICLLYICIVLYLAVGVVIFKASMLNWLVVSSAIYIYMHFTRYSSGCSLIQGIHAQLTGVFICLQYICIVLDIVVDVALYKASMLDWLGCSSALYIYIYALYYIQQWVLHYTRHLCLIDWGVYLSSIYMHCTRYSSWCSLIQVIYAWLTGRFICLQYICIVLDLAVGVVVCKASVLDWLEVSSSIYIFALY